MNKIVKGNLLEAKEDIIAHQVNLFGVMGAGVAHQIAQKYPKVNELYKEQCECNKNKPLKLLGMVYVCEEKEKKIANLFCQNTYPTSCGNLTNYKAMEECFVKLNTMGLNIAIPYGIGCGIAHGNWEVVYKIIQKTCTDIDVTIYQL